MMAPVEMGPVAAAEGELVASALDAPATQAEPCRLLSVYASVPDFPQVPLPEIVDMDERKGISRASWSCGCRRRTVLIAVLTVCLVAISTCFSVLPRRSLAEHQQQFLQWRSSVVQEFQTQRIEEPLLSESNSCLHVESNVAYLYPRRVENFLEHIPEEKTCCRHCHNEPQCKSWTWIQKTKRCYFMDMLPLKKAKKAGYHSG
mmetsp:Transcript_39839/g.78782  ORF Transcript_39839/g.78782 Transcript_39839/m.78782 type:complete len:203 (-) Transcript_39839:315-923(-)